MKWKERNIIQFLPRAKATQGHGALFFSGLDDEQHFSPATLTPKAGLIMWSSTVRLIEMLSLILFPMFQKSLVFSKNESEDWER